VHRPRISLSSNFKILMNIIHARQLVTVRGPRMHGAGPNCVGWRSFPMAPLRFGMASSTGSDPPTSCRTKERRNSMPAARSSCLGSLILTPMPSSRARAQMSSSGVLRARRTWKSSLVAAGSYPV
jgi:hypothetical protein